MKSISLANELAGNSYPGRGIVIGKSADGKYAVAAYFIMGRSENSRNRVFVEDGEGIRTQAFDPSKLSDPSLIIYAPVRVLGNKTIVTNGDQTDTIYELMDKQQTFEQALRTREFEPDAPNYTPRISGIMHIDNGTYNYATVIHLHIRIRLPEKHILSTLIWETETRFQVLRENQSLLVWKETLIPLPVWYGKILMRRTKFPYLYVTLTLKPENTRQEL